MVERANIFLNQVKEAQNLDMGILEMPVYSSAKMANAEANAASWQSFKKQMKPLAIIQFNNQDIEYLVTEKSVAWGVRDINIFAGQDDRNIQELTDLERDEGVRFLGLNFLISKLVLERTASKSIQVNIGFNKSDTSEGHHSITKLHSHVRSVLEETDMQRRIKLQWRQMDRFDQMAFIEPFSVLFHDFIVEKVRSGVLSRFLTTDPIKRLGYTSLFLADDGNLDSIFEDLKNLYAAMSEEYSSIEGLFTDGTKDILSRYIPRPAAERVSRVTEFIETHNHIYSEDSKTALMFLAERLVPASPRPEGNPREMTEPGQMYISRGFGGAISFTFTRSSNTVRMDFLPRVVTTSGVSKTILGDSLPTVIAKTSSPASEEEKFITKGYQDLIVGILREKIDGLVLANEEAPY